MRELPRPDNEGVSAGQQRRRAALGLTVRWAKGTAGSGPRRRTVLTGPKFDWAAAVELVNWLSDNKIQLIHVTQGHLDEWVNAGAVHVAARRPVPPLGDQDEGHVDRTEDPTASTRTQRTYGRSRSC